MPIWSLTKERVEKLLKQVGDKELEIDTLLKLTKEDLWKRDLDEFIAEWRFQLDDEAKRQKKISSLNRRASSKMGGGGGGGGRKRKGAESDDSDFEGASKRKKAPKQPKPVGGLLSYLAPPPAKTKTSDKPKAPSAAAKAAQRTLNLLEAPKESVDDVWMNLDGSGDDHKATKARTAAPLKKAAPKKRVVTDDDEDEDIVRPTATRQPRAAAAKPVKYNTLDSDSDGEDMLFDVGKMVKGIDTAPADKSRQLFAASASRPSSSSGLPKKPVPSKQTFDMDVDDTNYSMLVPPTTAKGPAVTAREAILSDDEHDSMDDIVYAAPKASKPKPAPKAAPKPKAPTKTTTKAVSQPPEPKKNILSPVGKAYAAMRAKQAAKKDDDPVEKIADEIMDDDEDGDEAPAPRRPGRRAAAAPKKWVISDDEDEDEDEGVTADFDDDDTDD